MDRRWGARRQRLDGTEAWIVSADDLLIYRLVAARPQDLAGVDQVIRFGRAPAHPAYVEKWVREWELEDRLDRALAVASR